MGLGAGLLAGVEKSFCKQHTNGILCPATRNCHATASAHPALPPACTAWPWPAAARSRAPSDPATPPTAVCKGMQSLTCPRRLVVAGIAVQGHCAVQSIAHHLGVQLAAFSQRHRRRHANICTAAVPRGKQQKQAKPSWKGRLPVDTERHPGRRCRCSLRPTVREAASLCHTVHPVWQTGASCAHRPGTQPFPPFCLLSSFTPAPRLTGMLRAEVLHERGCKAGGQGAARLLPQTLGHLCSRWEGGGARRSIKQGTSGVVDSCTVCRPLWHTCWGLKTLSRFNQLTRCFKHQL